MKRLRWLMVTATAVAALVVMPVAALAFGAQSGEAVTVPKGETRHGTQYLAGRTVTVDGDIDGDLFCAGMNITVTGTVHGDVICAGQALNLTGHVDGNVRVAAQTLTLGGTVARNASVAGQTISVTSDISLGGDLSVLGQTVTVNGPVGRDVYGAMQTVTINAPVTGRADLWTDGLTLGSGAKIGGDLSYTSQQTFRLDSGKVGGQISRHEPPKQLRHREPRSPREIFLAWLGSWIYWTLAGLVVALPLAAAFPRPLRAITNTMAGRFGPSLGWGALVTFLAPAVLVLLAITVIGLPLAVLAGVAWALALAVAGVLAGITVGRWVVRRSDWNQESLLLAALVGIPIAYLVMAVPFVGGLAGLVAMLWGAGGLVLSAARVRR